MRALLALALEWRKNSHYQSDQEAKPQPIPASRRRFFSMFIWAEWVGEAEISSEVTRSMIAVSASQRLMSESDRGKLVLLALDARAFDTPIANM